MWSLGGGYGGFGLVQDRRTVGGLRRRHTDGVVSAFCPVGGVVSWVGLDSGGVLCCVAVVDGLRCWVLFGGV
jgi:hypothetical protein